MAGLFRMQKNILGAQAAVSLMLLSKNLLFLTLFYVKKMYKNTMGEMGLQTSLHFELKYFSS